MLKNFSSQREFRISASEDMLLYHFCPRLGHWLSQTGSMSQIGSMSQTGSMS